MYKIENLKTSGRLPRAGEAVNGSNAQVSINTSEDVLIRNCDFGMSGYNCIEIALKAGCMPKNITIENCTFSGTLNNNSVSIFDTAPDAVIRLKNCRFVHSSNPLRLSARSNNACTVYIEDCVCDRWDTTPKYAGFMLLQDYTSTEFTEENLNKFRNVTINISNLKVPEGYEMKGEDGMLKFTDARNVCSTGEYGSQLLYMYRDKAETKLVPYDETFPTINLV